MNAEETKKQVDAQLDAAATLLMEATTKENFQHAVELIHSAAMLETGFKTGQKFAMLTRDPRNF